MLISSATVKILEQATETSVAKPLGPWNGGRWRMRWEERKRLFKRKKLVTTSTSRVTQGVDYLIEVDAMIATKGASGCQRFDSKRHSKGQ